MKSFGIILACLFILVLIFRFIPVGTRTFPGATYKGIEISEPRYWIPREIIFPSRTSAHFRILPHPDPHYAATASWSFQFDRNGEKVNAISQGYDVNWRFTNEANKRHILAIQVDDSIRKYLAPGICFGCWGDTDQLRFLGLTKTKLVFLVQRPRSSSKEIGFVAVDSRLRATDTASVALEGSPEFEDLVSEVREVGVSDVDTKGICEIRSKVLSRFMYESFGVSCGY